VGAVLGTDARGCALSRLELALFRKPRRLERGFDFKGIIYLLFHKLKNNGAQENACRAAIDCNVGYCHRRVTCLRIYISMNNLGWQYPSGTEWLKSERILPTQELACRRDTKYSQFSIRVTSFQLNDSHALLLCVEMTSRHWIEPLPKRCV